MVPRAAANNTINVEAPLYRTKKKNHVTRDRQRRRGALITACRTRFDRKAANTYGFTMFLLLLLREYIIMVPSSTFCNNVLYVCVSGGQIIMSYGMKITLICIYIIFFKNILVILKL